MESGPAGAGDQAFAGTIHQVITAMNHDEDMSFEEPQMKDRNLLCGGRTHQLALTYTGCPNGPRGSCSKKRSFELIKWPDEIGHSTACFISLTVDNASDVVAANQLWTLKW